jgi:apolipoprotein D and lipocalin family protein
MKRLSLLFLLTSIFALGACAEAKRMSSAPVPEPAKPVDLARYQGKWFELARFEAPFQKDCEGVTAEYTPLPDGSIKVVNRCRRGSVAGPEKTAEATATIVRGSNNNKLKVAFFGPLFKGDYWILDRADDYSWAIIGEPSGAYLWILSRSPVVSQNTYDILVNRVATLGYDIAQLRKTQQPPAP